MPHQASLLVNAPPLHDIFNFNGFVEWLMHNQMAGL